MFKGLNQMIAIQVVEVETKRHPCKSIMTEEI